MNKQLIEVEIKQDLRQEKHIVFKQKNLMELLIEKKFMLVGACGRRGVCNSCLVLVNNKWEKACQFILVENTKVEIFSPYLVNKQKSVDLLVDHQYELALDIGTTTLVIYIVDKTNKEVVYEKSILNPQQVFGGDVMSRIVASEKHLNTMRKMIVDIVNEEINTFTGITFKRLVVVGNTTMLHLFLGVDPSSIGEAPYIPSFLEQKVFVGKDIKINTEEVILLPGKSAFIGADVISGVSLFLSRIEKKTTLYIDLGTNGEMVLHHQGKWFATSSAAGPAFEGACISCGVGGINGAIDHIKNEQWEYSTISNKQAIGICGSGLIDAIAQLRKQEKINEYGMFVNKEKSFKISSTIQITQEDIHQVQYAKSAIYSAICVLLKSANVSFSKIDEVLLAGGMGSYIDIKNAIYLKMFPKEWENKIDPIANASGYGAVFHLLEPNNKLSDLIAKIQVIDLATNPLFSELFLEELIIKGETNDSRNFNNGSTR